MTYLPDVNVWLAIAIAEHTHHVSAVEWLMQTSGPVAFCRITQMGFMRLLTNRRVMGDDVFTPERAWRTMEAFRADDRIVFVHEPPMLERSWRALTAAHKSGSNFWTDTYLAAVAETAGHILVTFDQGFRKYDKLPVRILS